MVNLQKRLKCKFSRIGATDQKFSIVKSKFRYFKSNGKYKITIGTMQYSQTIMHWMYTISELKLFNLHIEIKVIT
jgi:hypothetical protein